MVYQAVATLATVVGILVSDLAAMWLSLLVYTDEPPPPFQAFASHLLNYEGFTIALCVLGVMGGFWVWAQPGEAE